MLACSIIRSRAHMIQHRPSARSNAILVVLGILLCLVSLGLFRIQSTLPPPPTDFDDALCFGVFVCSEKVAPSLVNIEYYDWAYCSFDLAPLWSQLGVVDDRFTDSSSLSEAVSSFGDLDRDGKNERILRLTLK